MNKDPNFVLQVLISTCNERIDSVIQLVESVTCSSIGFVVIHQVFGRFDRDHLATHVSKLQNFESVRYERMEEPGLSKSRNRALELTTAPLALFCDDDVSFVERDFTQLVEAFSQVPDADVLTFRFVNADGKHWKKYPAVLTERTLFSCFKVSSVEIAFRVASVRQAGVVFDEAFGLGARYPVSEEAIFLTDLKKVGKRVYFFPADVVIHPNETSGGQWNEVYLTARGALFKRVFGWLGVLALLAFLCRHQRSIRKQTSFFRGIKVAVRAFMNFKSDSAS